MKDFDAAIKTVVEGLRSIAKGVEQVAEKLEKNAPKGKARTKSSPKSKTKAAAAKKSTAKKASAKKKTAADTVLTVINRSKKGVDSATLAKKTGYDKKKIANIVFKLKKQGKIKSVSRGVYVKV